MVIEPGQFFFASIVGDPAGRVVYGEGLHRSRSGKSALCRILTHYVGALADFDERGNGHLNRLATRLRVESVIVAERPPFNVRDVNAAHAWYRETHKTT